MRTESMQVSQKHQWEVLVQRTLDLTSTSLPFLGPRLSFPRLLPGFSGTAGLTLGLGMLLHVSWLRCCIDSATQNYMLWVGNAKSMSPDKRKRSRVCDSELNSGNGVNVGEQQWICESHKIHRHLIKFHSHTCYHRNPRAGERGQDPGPTSVSRF